MCTTLSKVCGSGGRPWPARGYGRYVKSRPHRWQRPTVISWRAPPTRQRHAAAAPELWADRAPIDRRRQVATSTASTAASTPSAARRRTGLERAAAARSRLRRGRSAQPRLGDGALGHVEALGPADPRHRPRRPPPAAASRSTGCQGLPTATSDTHGHPRHQPRPDAPRHARPRSTDKALKRALQRRPAAEQSSSPWPTSHDVVERFPHHPGARRLQAAADGQRRPHALGVGGRVPGLLQALRAPRAGHEHDVAGHEVDALFPNEQIIVELDSWEFHNDRHSFESDRDRDADTLAAGYVTRCGSPGSGRRTPAREAARLHGIIRRWRTARSGGGVAETETVGRLIRPARAA